MTKLYIGMYFDGDNNNWDVFASDRDAEGRKEQLREIIADNWGVEIEEVDMDDIYDTYAIDEVYDGSTKRNYKVILQEK